MQTLTVLLQALAGWPQPLVLGLGFGLLHAFDADHLATLGGLAANDRSLSPTAYAARWAAGHALSLGLVALAVLGLGVTQAASWSGFAEIAVGVALVAIGYHALRAAWLRRGARGTALHAHSSAEPHVHFLAPSHAHRRAERTGVLMGVLHGGAGSAAVLALLPLAHFTSGGESAAYLACFCAGVTVGALCFAALFGRIAARAAAAGERLTAVLQCCVGLLATASGCALLLELFAARIGHGGG